MTKRPTGKGLVPPHTGAREGSIKMAELDMSWVTEEQVVEDPYRGNDERDFDGFAL